MHYDLFNYKTDGLCNEFPYELVTLYSEYPLVLGGSLMIDLLLNPLVKY